MAKLPRCRMCPSPCSPGCFVCEVCRYRAAQILGVVPAGEAFGPSDGVDAIVLRGLDVYRHFFARSNADGPGDRHVEALEAALVATVVDTRECLARRLEAAGMHDAAELVSRDDDAPRPRFADATRASS